jgi:transketolase
LVALYYGKILQYVPNSPKWMDRDRFILSKAHGSNSLYVILADLGFYPKSELSQFLVDGSLLSGHTDHRIPGIEIAGGSLGHGLGVAAGIALGAKLSCKKYMTFVLIGDGESQEGSIWEAGMFASQQGLDNLIAITDRNQLGSEDFTENTLHLEPLADRWRAFGWDVKTIPGHSFESIFSALHNVRSRNSGRPLMVIAQTIKGKGISSLENTPQSHHTLPKGSAVDQTLKDLQ